MKIVKYFLLILVVGLILETQGGCVVQLGYSFSRTITGQRFLSLVQSSCPGHTQILPPTSPLPVNIPAGSAIFAVGTTVIGSSIISQDEKNKLGSEGYIVRSKVINNSNVYAVDGNPLQPNTHNLPTNNGVIYGAYDLLRELGFAFYHPLSPSIPTNMVFPTMPLNIVEKPYWPLRGFHYHTEHPLELTNFLNGWGEKGPNDIDGWSKMISEFVLVCEWLVANRQNYFEYVLLSAEEWADFANSTERQERLNSINNIAHSHGIMVGADIALASRQQHAWHITDPTYPIEKQKADAQSVVSWVFGANFDVLSTESGTSEFTNSGCKSMVQLMNITTEAVKNYPNKEIYIKVHVSTNQVCPDYNDPRTGKPINFNYLPYFADQDLGIFPHTVQMYRFDDPSANSYGNTNFTDMFNWIFYEINQRNVVYFPETAYWVNYDIDVPLFLPVYGAARLYDLRMIAAEQVKTGYKIKGQVVFDSGWEWAYWLSDLIAAQSAWNPRIDLSYDDALLDILKYITQPFGTNANAIAQLLANTISTEHNLLVLGKVNQTDPSSIIERNGISYLEGWDTWADISRILGVINTQPVRLDLEAMYLPWKLDFYSQSVKPLLNEMEQQFTNLVNQYLSYNTSIPPTYAPLYSEIVDSMMMTQLRSQQVSASYDYLWFTQPTSWRNKRLQDAIQALNNAEVVIERRENHYRVPLDRIAGWNQSTPTVYGYGYIWTVHSAFYFYRDIIKVMKLNIDTFSPCFMNIINPIDVAFGEGLALNVTQQIQELADKYGWGFVGDCLHSPEKEPVYQIPTKK